VGLARFLDIAKLAALSGGPGFAQIAVTNDCNADCGFCNFARGKGIAKSSAPVNRLLRAIDTLHAGGVRYLVFVGGEPLVYGGLEDAISHTRDKGIEPVICTNGQLLHDDKIKRLKAAGLRNIIISIDAPDAETHDKNRGLPGLTDRIRRANKTLASSGMHSTASVTISRLVGDFKKLPAYLRDMGFKDVTFSYPLRELHSTYLSFSDSELVEYSKDELIGIFLGLKALKKDIKVLNPSAGMDEMIRFLKNEPSRFPCLAGYKYFFLDWNLDVYRCHYMKDRICAVEDFPGAAPIRDGCDICMIDCYRDPSVLQHVAVSFRDSVDELLHGHLGTAYRRLFNQNNYISLKAVAEEFGLVTRYGGR